MITQNNIATILFLFIFCTFFFHKEALSDQSKWEDFLRKEEPIVETIAKERGISCAKALKSAGSKDAIFYAAGRDWASDVLKGHFLKDFVNPVKYDIISVDEITSKRNSLKGFYSNRISYQNCKIDKYFNVRFFYLDGISFKVKISMEQGQFFSFVGLPPDNIDVHREAFSRLMKKYGFIYDNGSPSKEFFFSRKSNSFLNIFPEINYDKYVEVIGEVCHRPFGLEQPDSLYQHCIVNASTKNGIWRSSSFIEYYSSRTFRRYEPKLHQFISRDFIIVEKQDEAFTILEQEVADYFTGAADLEVGVNANPFE